MFYFVYANTAVLFFVCLKLVLIWRLEFTHLVYYPVKIFKNDISNFGNFRNQGIYFGRLQEMTIVDTTLIFIGS